MSLGLFWSLQPSSHVMYKKMHPKPQRPGIRAACNLPWSSKKVAFHAPVFLQRDYKTDNTWMLVCWLKNRGFLVNVLGGGEVIEANLGGASITGFGGSILHFAIFTDSANQQELNKIQVGCPSPPVLKRQTFPKGFTKKNSTLLFPWYIMPFTNHRWFKWSSTTKG